MQLVDACARRDDALLTLETLMLWSGDERLQILTPDDCGNTPWVGGCDVSAAVNASAAVLADSLQLEQEKRRLGVARGGMAPTLVLSAGVSTTYYTYPTEKDYVAEPFADQLKNNCGQYVQLSLSIPLYDRLGRFTQVRKQRNAVRRAQTLYEQERQHVQAEVLRALADGEAAARADKMADARVAAQGAAFAINRRRHALGLVSGIEMRTSADNYLAAKAEKYSAWLKLQLKNAVVRYYAGQPYLQQQFNL